VAAGSALDWLLGTGPALTLLGLALALVYLIGTFGATMPFFGRVASTRAEPDQFALTFDDGPDPRNTPEISRLLAARGHRATFFVLGAHARRYPNVLAQVLADGHELANHGDDHRLLAFSLPSTLRRQLSVTEEAVRAATGHAPVRLFRTPHGVRSPWLSLTVGRCGYRLCGWTGRVFDTAEPGALRIVERTCRHLVPGSILLLHDADGSECGGSRQQTVEALPAILDEAERRGLRSVWLSSLVETSPGLTSGPRPPTGRRVRKLGRV
jgi:peptidoglycan-N-acetylglucosamine deacetylase